MARKNSLPGEGNTGNVVRPGGYPLTDATYANLLHRLTRLPSQSIPPGIKRDILAYSILTRPSRPEKIQESGPRCRPTSPHSPK